MERFLISCAEYIFKQHAHKLHDVCIIFPNRRSGNFFNSYLQKQLSTPVIGPHVTTIHEFIAGYSELHSGEKLLLISELYTVFKKYTQSTESFDDFYFWGEVLLSDFSDIDSYLTDAKDLFTNVSDLKEIDQLFDYLTPEQKAALSRFWGSVSVPGKKSSHDKFFSIWDKLFPIYNEFRRRLENKGIGYPGMINREVAELFKNNQPEPDFEKYYVVGLNALNSCEKVIFNAIRKHTGFLWDYDDFYLNDKRNEAGKFLRENLVQFPPPDDFITDTSGFARKKKINLVAVPSAYGQTQEIPHFLEENRSAVGKNYDSTAVVLADESLLFPALGAMPDDFDSINVTMGYPVKNSVVYGFLLLLMNLIRNRRISKDGQQHAYHRLVTDVLNHQLLNTIEPEKVKQYLGDLRKYNRVNVPVHEIDFSDLHRLIFKLPADVGEYSRYFIEVLGSLYRLTLENDPENKLIPELILAIYQATGRIEKMVNDLYQIQGMQLSDQVWFRLFNQYVGQASVNYEGEPLKGIQVMGILETRCLDFDNLIILGLNENKWPKTSTAPSFIPFNIRKGFGLPGTDEQDAMYAYYFFRLVQRAQNITATYSTIKEGIGTGELSRYGYQLLYGSNLPVTTATLDFHFMNDPAPELSVAGSADHIAALLAGNSDQKPLSPTALNMWLQCSLRFYFRYILKLAEPDEMKDEIDSPVFGSIFHETMENLYKPMVGKTVTPLMLETIKKDEVRIRNEITKAIGKHYFKQTAPGKVALEGKTILIFENIRFYVNQVLEVDIKQAPFDLLMLEKHITAPFLVPVNGTFREINLGGVIDRVDVVKDKLRIIDYKTGNVEAFTINNLEELFEKNSKKPKKEILQALIYCLVYMKNNKTHDSLSPAIYSLRKVFEENFNPSLKIDKAQLIFKDIEEEFTVKLQELITEMLTPASGFSQTPHKEVCKYCAYNKICQRY